MVDDPALRDRVDPSGFWRLIAELPQQARAARALGQAWELPASFVRPSRVVILGMGGSAIGGDVVAAVASGTGSVPVEVVRDYSAPPTDERTLLVACSYSGNTEEVLTAFSAQLDGPGMRLVLTTGGRLAQLSRERGIPLLKYEFGGPPRTAMGFGVFPLLELLRRLDAIAIEPDLVEGALSKLDRGCDAWGPDRPAATNQAKQLAMRLQDRLPVIVGADGLAVAARRWVGQIAENAKQWSFPAVLPEADHNAIVALERRQQVERALHVVLFDGPALQERNHRRVEITAAELASADVAHETVAIEASDPLAAVLEACCLGDWASYYLALLNGVDPLETPILDRVKETLRQAPAR